MNLRERERGYGTKKKRRNRKKLFRINLQKQERISEKNKKKNIKINLKYQLGNKRQKKDKIREYVMFNTEC